MVEPSTPIELTAAEVGAWWTRVELARARRKHVEDLWIRLLEAYLPPADANSDAVNSNAHFRNTESKKAQLFFQLPELQLTPLEPMSALADPNDPTGKAKLDGYSVIATKRAVLSKLLGRDHANVLHTFDQAVFDILQTSGVAFTKICYEADFQPMQQEVQVGEVPAAGSEVLGLQTVPEMAMQTVEVPIYEKYRWYRFSAKAGLIPHDWFSTRFDEAPWLGMEFALPVREAIRLKIVPEGHEAPAGDGRELILQAGGRHDTDSTNGIVRGVEIWAHAAQFRDGVYHSELFDRIYLVDGQKDTAKAESSPYQSSGPDGRLTADSMIGNPIHPMTLREVSDETWVPSDAAFTNPLVKQKNTWRSQDIKLRDANLPRFFYSDDMTEAVEKLKNADVGQGVGIPNDKMMQGADKIIAAIPHMERAQADIQGEASINRDIADTLGIDANQGGALNEKIHSATEVATAQANTNVRLQKERAMLIERYLCGVRKFDSLIQRYADQQDYVEIVGLDGARKLQAWNKTTLAGRYAFDARPDSQLANDAASERKQWLDFVNFMAKSQFMNQAEIARITTLKYGQDPARLVVQPQPPGPPPPNVSVKVAIEDLAGPAGSAALKVLQQAGYQLTEQDLAGAQANGLIILKQEAAMQAAKTAHGGAADQTEKLSKHHSEETGNMPGRVPEGAPPMQTPGMVN